ncbi:MAG: hypothetical protein JSV03_10500, partial [Planctomycetota bacterium]
MIRRHAFTLVQVIILLPIIAAVFTVCFQLSSRALSLQCQENRQIADDTRLRELVRRIQRDAGLAHKASVEQVNGGTQLQLDYDDKNVLYRADMNGVTRIERHGDKSKKSLVWTMGSVRVAFELEEINSKPCIVWIKFDSRSSRECGPDLVWQMSAAATVG